MRISSQNKQLIRVAGGINLLFLLLCVIFLFYLGRDLSPHSDLMRKIVRFMLANSICWIVNLALLLVPLQITGNSRLNRVLMLYLPSYIITFILSVIIANSGVHPSLGDEEPITHPITGPIFFVVGIDTLSLVAIELIQSRQAAANFRLEYANIQAENARLQVKSLEAQQEKLKNQLHPHFLFNSLSALKSLIRRDPNLAEEYLMKLSGFLRFSMSHNEQNVVPLTEELKFSIDYLEMQKIRFRAGLQYTVDIPHEKLTTASLPVFSLQLVIENAIKHNLLDQENPLHINIRYIDTGWLSVENNIQPKYTVESASGIGLKNLSDRYQLLAQESIRVEHNSEHFTVYLKVIPS
jgi:sensor histidine kinase YesM